VSATWLVLPAPNAVSVSSSQPPLVRCCDDRLNLPWPPRSLWCTRPSVSARAREKALVALMCFGGLRRSEIVALDVGDVAPGLGLRRVQGKGGVETAVPLPKVAQDIVAGYIATARANANASDPLFVSCFKTKGGHVTEVRMKGHRVWKITKAIGECAGVPELHPHAFRHSSGVQLLRLTRELDAQERGLHRRDSCRGQQTRRPGRWPADAGRALPRNKCAISLLASRPSFPDATMSSRAADFRTRCTCACSALTA
jgi:integrase